MRFLTFLGAITCCLWNMSSHATVSGSQHIEILGYDTQQQRLYMLRHFDEAKQHLPQLYYFDFTSKQPQQAIEETALYIDSKTGKINTEQNTNEFTKKLNSIKNRLSALYPLNPKIFEIEFETSQPIHALSGDEQQLLEPYHYKIKNGHYLSSTQSCVRYDPNLKVNQAFRLPKQDKIIVTVIFSGINFETEYTIEQPVLLIPSP